MKCPKCGKEIDAKRNFCEYCGTQIKKNRKPLFITIAIVACLLILGGIGLTQYNKGEQERTRLERELSMYKLKAVKAESKANAEHEARLKAEAELRLEREARLKAERKRQEAYARTYGNINGHEYVDLGLPSGLKWATCNVGASKPEDYGNYYYTCGNLKYDIRNVICDKSIGFIEVNSQYDAARVNWGGTWRLPRVAECKELVDKCTWKWTTQNGVNGYKVVGPNGNSIFLPAAGDRFWSSLYAGEYGGYSSSTPDESNSNLAHRRSEPAVDYSILIDGLLVRPVIE